MQFHLEKGIIEIDIVDRDVDKQAQIGKTYPMHLSDIIQQLSRVAAKERDFDLIQFEPREIRINEIYQKDTFITVEYSLESKEGKKIKKGTTRKYSENQRNFYKLFLTTFGKCVLNYLGTHYPESRSYLTELNRGYRPDRIERITYFVKFDDTAPVPASEEDMPPVQLSLLVEEEKDQ